MTKNALESIFKIISHYNISLYRTNKTADKKSLAAVALTFTTSVLSLLWSNFLLVILINGMEHNSSYKANNRSACFIIL